MVQALSIPQTSLCNLVWEAPPANFPQSSLGHLCEQLEISAGLAMILATRGLLDSAEAARFLAPVEEHLHAPLAMLGMQEGVDRIFHALQNYEKILICGDYDVDGTASAAILYSYLKRLDARVHYFIPHRINDGYGITPDTVAKFKSWEVDLLITTDHGSTACEGAELLHREGIDLIITDHHQPGEVDPRCVAQINPAQGACTYPFKELSAAGVAFKLVTALDEFLAGRDYWNSKGICRTAPGYYLDLVALATVADMTPLLGENRTLVKLGLDMMNNHPRPGLSGLIRECNVRKAVSPHTISFRLAPKINAVGRIGDPGLAVRLMLSHSFTEARRLARNLVEVNRQRRQIEDEVYRNAIKQIEDAGAVVAHVIVGSGWHPGVIGSIASRLAAETHRPTVVLTNHSSSQLLGSARNWSGGSILAALLDCGDLLERCGGHPNAAGLCLATENLEAFTHQFRQAVACHAPGTAVGRGEALRIEAWLTPDMLDGRFFSDVARLAPFGHRNPEPVVAVRAMTVANPTLIQNRHFKFGLRCQDGREIEANAWHRPDWKLCHDGLYDIAFVPQVQEDSGKLQAKVVDMMPHA